MEKNKQLKLPSLFLGGEYFPKKLIFSVYIKVSGKMVTNAFNVIDYEKFRKVMQQTEKEALIHDD